MPADRRIEYRVVDRDGNRAGECATLEFAREWGRVMDRKYPGTGPHRVDAQRTITVGPWTDVEGDETDE
jgi:hypothetical protein